ncbi:polysaccharide deacetylase family protein [Sphingobium sp. JS3065]|uniref:polysaccharide deacetylase family protein n=1 Tax=Sphingobium sp. JS3065 TaxID=2970925 RepID=UPI0022646FB9|nr:polysaccharide deacetylase family protein [Sphingobium sp. JS3065]UZW57781.1 polysaccharide deacetylase family protein [Sphingobium sp. JS3065]
MGTMAGMMLLAAPRDPADYSHDRQPFDIAITVDDLSGNGDLPPGMTRLAIADLYLRTLKRHRVPDAHGLVNVGKLRRDRDGAAVLDRWRRAGYSLGNHSYSHMNLNRAPSLQAWEADVVTGEEEIARRMEGADWRYFRFPNMAAGRDKAQHDSAIAFLKERGYRIAEASVSFDDWAYSDAYARCLRTGDRAAVAAMKAQYLKGVDDGIVRMKALSHAVYGRMIPQVLLTHLSAWGADTLPDVLARLDAAGARYVSLPQAQRDPAYAGADPWAGNQLLMDRAARQRRIDVEAIPKPHSPVDPRTLCR